MKAAYPEGFSPRHLNHLEVSPGDTALSLELWTLFLYRNGAWGGDGAARVKLHGLYHYFQSASIFFSSLSSVHTSLNASYHVF